MDTNDDYKEAQGELEGQIEPAEGGKVSTKKADKKTKAKKKRNSKGLANGVFVLVAILAIFGGGAGYQFYYTNEKIEEQRAQIRDNEERTTICVKKQKELEFYDQQAANIEKNHQFIKDSGSGPGKKTELTPLPEYGFSIQDMTSIKVAKTSQAGWVFEGNRAEWQKILNALSSIEGKYPLLQFSKLNLSLPDNVKPLTDSPTFLRTRGELYSPRL